METPAGRDPASTPRSRLGWVGLVVSGVVLVAFRLHAFDLPLENDECNYAYIGQRLLAGDRLYVDVWDHQPFGVFALFAGVIAVFGDAPEVFRWMTTVFSLLSLGLVFAILRRVAGSSAAVGGAILFALASSDPGTAGEGCNREIYMATLILAAWYAALRSEGRRGWWLLASGTSLGLASMVKTIVAVHWVFLALWVIVVAGRGAARTGHSPATTQRIRSTMASIRSAVTSLLWLAVGPLVLWMSAFAYFRATSRCTEFVDAVFLFNLSYSGGSEGFFPRFVRFFAPPRHPFIFDSAWPLWIGGAGAVVWLGWNVIIRRSRRASAVLLLIVGSYAAICLPGRFWPHYYYLLIPVLSVAVGMSVAGVLARLSRHGRLPRPAFFVASAVAWLAFPAALFATEYRSYLSQPPFGITVKRYNSRDFWGRAHGENVRRVTDPDDTIFVFGNDAEIYYYAKRRCASRFTMITGVQTGYADVDRRRAMLLADLKEHRPRLILVLFDERHPWEEWTAFLHEYYGEPIGWDRHDRTRDPIMMVLARKDQPVEPIDWDWDRSQVGGWFLGERR